MQFVNMIERELLNGSIKDKPKLEHRVFHGVSTTGSFLNDSCNRCRKSRATVKIRTQIASGQKYPRLPGLNKGEVYLAHLESLQRSLQPLERWPISECNTFAELCFFFFSDPRDHLEASPQLRGRPCKGREERQNERWRESRFTRLPFPFPSSSDTCHVG